MNASSSSYANDVLVSADWVEERLDAFLSDDPDLRLLEVNSPESPEKEFGFQWDEDLSDAVERDILSKESFEKTIGNAGITEDSTVIFYGDGHIAN